MPSPQSLLEICEAGNKADPASFAKRGLKLMEECGEISVEIQKMEGYVTSKYKADGTEKQKLKEECVDALLCVGSLLAQVGASQKELDELMKKKAQKWMEKAQK